MDPHIVARVLAFLPPVLVFLWVLRMGSLDGKATARRLADLAAYARSRGLTLGPGPSTSAFTLTGTYEGLALAIDTPSIGSGKGTRTVTRVVLRLDAGSGAGERALVVGRLQPVDLAELAGLTETPTGDATFDQRFRVYLPTGAVSPAADPVFRAACLHLDRESRWAIDRIHRAEDEITVALGSVVLDPPALDRALLLASALASEDRAQRAASTLGMPIFWEEPAEVRRAAWSLLPFSVALLGSMALGPILTMINPLTLRLAELAACDEDQRLVTIGTGRKSWSFFCVGPGAEREGANLWTFLVGCGLHFFAIALVVVLLRAAFAKRRARAPHSQIA